MRPALRLLALPPTLRALLADPPVSKQLVVSGWIKSLRQHKNVAFGEVEDGTGSVQGVWKGKARADGLTPGSSVRLSGRLEPSRGSGQELELLVDETMLLGECDPESYPIQKKHLPLPHLRDHAHLRFRTAQMGAVTRVRDGLMRDWHEWFEDNDFTHIHTPILTSSDCEGAGEVFSLAPIYAAHPAAAATAQTGMSSIAREAEPGDRSPSMPPSVEEWIPPADSAPSSHSSSSISSNRNYPTTSSSTVPTSPPSTSQTPSFALTPVEDPQRALTSSLPSRHPFFPTPPNLTVSAQLHLESPTHALSRTYTLSPAFRAEPSLTSRHLSEFYMLEAEVAFVETLDALMNFVEEGMRAVLKRIMWGGQGDAGGTPSETGEGLRNLDRKSRRPARMRSDLEIIHSTLENPLEGRGGRPPLMHILNAAARPFARITYTDAVDLLSRTYSGQDEDVEDDSIPLGVTPPTWGEGLSTEHEKWLARYLDGPVFVTHYPKGLKPFYMLPSDADASSQAERSGRKSAGTEAEQSGRETVACFDLLFPGIGEMAGGSLREHRLVQLERAMDGASLDKAAYQWYLDLRRYGSSPHGGWGMGWDRWVCWVTGVANIRDVVPFPRWRGNCRY